MKVFAIADLHLAYGTPTKKMDVFGEHWVGHADAIAAHWRERIDADDLVLVPGDISWAMRGEGARPDLEYLAALPGTKVITKGNHDYWWPASRRKLDELLPDSVRAVQGDAVRIGPVVIAGTRMWDIPGVRFGDIVDWQPSAVAGAAAEEEEYDPEQQLRIYRREVGRLARALSALEQLTANDAGLLRIAITHYPPCSAALERNELTELFEAHRVRHVVFGHLHSLYRDLDPRPFGERDGVTYHLTACDYLDFDPVLIDEA